MTAVAFALVVHNHCFSLLPRVALPLESAAMAAIPGTRAVTVAFHHSPGDTPLNPRSRVTLTENGVTLNRKFRRLDVVLASQKPAWCHRPDALVFTSTDGTDPRTNGRRYLAYSPPLYSRAIGYTALAVLIVSVVLRRYWSQGNSSETPPVRPVSQRKLWAHAFAAGAVFACTLYFNTGTLAPYANTLYPAVHFETGYLYNIDHSEHQKLFAFVAGEPRQAWEDSLLLRRILHPVVAGPWMRAFGYELGGVLFNITANLLGFAAGVAMVRRHVGTRAAIFAAWLLALYPGAAYWVGQPYAYGIIFPFGIAAFWILLELPGARPIRVMLLSLLLGLVYLSYDFHVYFIPASFLLLAWHRRFGMAVLATILQTVPIAAWLWLLKHVVNVPFENSNSRVYGQLVSAFFDLNTPGVAARRAVELPEVALEVFFGANFLFLPLLVVVAWIFGFPRGTFTRHRAASVLFASAALLFVFCNLPPPGNVTWNMQGSWIARIYQPIFPALLFALAVWWESLPHSSRGIRALRATLVAVVFAGNALVCFGPALGNPLGISEHALYRFYNHTDCHWVYSENLEQYGQRPLGFPRRVNPQ